MPPARKRRATGGAPQPKKLEVDGYEIVEEEEKGELAHKKAERRVKIRKT